MTGHVTRVRVGEYEYDIPDIWLAGMCVNQGITYRQAVYFWHYQCRLEAIENGEVED